MRDINMAILKHEIINIVIDDKQTNRIKNLVIIRCDTCNCEKEPKFHRDILL